MSGFFSGIDSFFNCPSSSSFESSKFGSSSTCDPSPSPAQTSNALVIQELDANSMQLLRGKDDSNGQADKYGENLWANRNPHIEHPDDQTEGHNKNSRKSTYYGTDHGKEGGTQGRTSGVTFQRVSYGGINGPFYTASTRRTIRKDGVVMEERQQADSTTGLATHQISRGIHDKGHSVTRKLDPNGKVDTKQTLYNLHEDELPSFEETWKGKARSHPSGKMDGPNSSGGTSDLLFGRYFGRELGRQLHNDMQPHSSSGRSKKVITTVPIE